MCATTATRLASGVELAMPRLLGDDGTIVACLRRFDGSQMTIGSSQSAGLCLWGDPFVEPEHACIRWVESAQAHVLEDWGSGERIELDGVRLKRPTRLTNGARFRVGTTDLVYCCRLPMPGYTSTLAQRIRPSQRYRIQVGSSS
ncbi:MAG TPA: FHA domain-containing protein [Thermomicrobiales bacterium]|nr:FHA domain-containing protein [Thermomicrobiales bacterium]